MRGPNRVECCDSTSQAPLSIEKVGFGLWWRRLLDFLSRSDGGSCLNKKNRGRRNPISNYIPVDKSFILERAFSVTKFHFGDAKFLTNRDRVLSGISPL